MPINNLLELTPKTFRNRYGANMGGLQYLYFVPKEWVKNDVQIAYNGYVEQEVTLAVGRSWLFAQFLKESLQYQEVPKSNADGDYIDATLTGTFLMDDMTKNSIYTNLRYHEFVVITYDFNRPMGPGYTFNRRVIGNKSKGMNLSVEFSTDKRLAGAVGYQLTFTHQMQDHAPVYRPWDSISAPPPASGSISVPPPVGTPAPPPTSGSPFPEAGG